jgi:hypothetical protein
MAKRDAKYQTPHLPVYQDLEWLLGSRLPYEDVTLPVHYAINPDETEENSLVGPVRDKLIDLFNELSASTLTEEGIDETRSN